MKKVCYSKYWVIRFKTKKRLWLESQSGSKGTLERHAHLSPDFSTALPLLKVSLIQKVLRVSSFFLSILMFLPIPGWKSSFPTIATLRLTSLPAPGTKTVPVFSSNTTKQSGRSIHLKSLEHFRAIAIILIVAGHCYGISGWHISSFADRVLANIITGGTSLFVFISGFLFHHVFYPTFNYKIFIKMKVQNVLFPYLFLSIFGIAQALFTHGPFPAMYFGPQQTVMDQVVKPVVLYLFTGGVLVYWYIPFIMCIFLLSPFFVRFIHCSAPTRIGITSLLLLVSLFMQRPVNNFLVPQSVVFFTPVYLFGIVCSIHKEWIYKKLGNRSLFLLIGAFLLAVLQALLFKACGDFQKPPFQLHGIDINLLQKICMCLFFMTLLHKYENLNSRLLQMLASSSFAIYFLHAWFIDIISHVQWMYTAVYGFHLVFISCALIIWISYLLASQVKLIFPKKSRLLIGW